MPLQMGAQPKKRLLMIAGLLAVCWPLPSIPQPEQNTPSRAIPQASPQEIQRLQERAQIALSKGQYSSAEKDYNLLLRMGVHSAAVYSNLGVVYLRTGKLDEAVQVLKKARTLAPNVAGVRLNLGLAYYRQREFKQASRYFGEVLSIDAGNTQARYLKGICDFMTDDFAAAVKAFEPIEESEGNDLEYLFMLGTSYGMLKRTDDSRRAFERLVEVGGDTSHLHLLLGKAYLALGQQEKAESELQRATKGDTLPYAHYYLGVLYRQLGKTELAAAEFEKEMQIAPNNPWAYKELSTIKWDQGDLRGAIAILEKGNAANPDTADLLAALGRGYLQVAEAVRAVDLLKRAVALDPKNSSYHYELGRAYLKTGHKAEANEEMALARSLLNEGFEGQMGALSRDSNPGANPNASH
jgi:Flp pilus assembly protein TadD